MSRNNLEYGAIIDADDDNDGDLVLPLSALSLCNAYSLLRRDKQTSNSMA